MLGKSPRARRVRRSFRLLRVLRATTLRRAIRGPRRRKNQRQCARRLALARLRSLLRRLAVRRQPKAPFRDRKPKDLGEAQERACAGRAPTPRSTSTAPQITAVAAVAAADSRRSARLLHLRRARRRPDGALRRGRAIPRRRTSTPQPRLGPLAARVRRGALLLPLRARYMRGKRANAGIASSWGVAFLGALRRSEFSRRPGHPSEGGAPRQGHAPNPDRLLPHGAQARCSASRSSASLAPRRPAPGAFSLGFPTPDRLLLAFGFGDADAVLRLPASPPSTRAEAPQGRPRARARSCAGGERGARPRAAARPRRFLRETSSRCRSGGGAGDRGGADLFESRDLHRRAAVVARAADRRLVRPRALRIVAPPASSAPRCGRTAAGGARRRARRSDREAAAGAQGEGALKEGRAKLRACAAAAAAAETREQREAQRRAPGDARAAARRARRSPTASSRSGASAAERARGEVKRSAERTLEAPR